MQTVTKEAFAGLFQQGIALALKETQKQVADPLPKELYLGLEAFGQRGKALSMEEVLSFLSRDGTFPRVVDIAVRGIREGRTFIWIRPSGHAYVNDFTHTWNTPVGMDPFKRVVSRFLWQRSALVSTQELKEEGEKW